MGGLVLTYYLGYGPQKPESAMMSWEGARKIQRVVFMGVPYHGVMTVLRNMEKGADFPINKGILPAETVASFPSSYYLLPTGAPLLLDRSGKSLNQVLYVPALWSQYKMGLLKSTTLTSEVRMERERFLEQQLARFHRFSDLIQLGRTTSWPPPTGFKALNIVGRGTNTLDGAFLVRDSLIFDEKEVKEENLQRDLLLRDGDGTVAFTSTTVPEALTAVTEIMHTDARHDQLWLGNNVLGRISGFLE
jgi:hypothetical protein